MGLRGAARPPSAETFYADAIENMRHLPQPTNLSYVVAEHVSGANIWLVRHPDGSASFGFNYANRDSNDPRPNRHAYRVDKKVSSGMMLEDSSLGEASAR